jgi:hypothetical protein
VTDFCGGRTRCRTRKLTKLLSQYGKSFQSDGFQDPAGVRLEDCRPSLLTTNPEGSCEFTPYASEVSQSVDRRVGSSQETRPLVAVLGVAKIMGCTIPTFFSQRWGLAQLLVIELETETRTLLLLMFLF